MGTGVGVSVGGRGVDEGGIGFGVDVDVDVSGIETVVGSAAHPTKRTTSRVIPMIKGINF